MLLLVADPLLLALVDDHDLLRLHLTLLRRMLHGMLWSLRVRGLLLLTRQTRVRGNSWLMSTARGPAHPWLHRCRC